MKKDAAAGRVFDCGSQSSSRRCISGFGDSCSQLLCLWWLLPFFLLVLQLMVLLSLTTEHGRLLTQRAVGWRLTNCCGERRLCTWRLTTGDPFFLRIDPSFFPDMAVPMLAEPENQQHRGYLTVPYTANSIIGVSRRRPFFVARSR